MLLWLSLKPSKYYDWRKRQGRRLQELTIKLPDKLWHRLEKWARIQKRGIEEVAIERLKTIPPIEESDSQEKYEKFFKESGLFIQVSEEEKKRYKPVNDIEREKLAQKFSIGKPLSEIIIKDRG